MNGFRAQTIEQISRFLTEETSYVEDYTGDPNTYVYKRYAEWAIERKLHVYTVGTFIGTLRELGAELKFEEGKIPGNARPGRWRGLRIVQG